MNKKIIAFILMLFITFTIGFTAEAHGHRGGGYRSSRSYSHRSYSHRPYSYHYRTYHPRAYHLHTSNFNNEHRSMQAKHDFWNETGYPHGRPGYVVDHKNPLACGGADAPSNMQWQTIAVGKAKDKTERIGCKGGHRI